MSIQKMNRVDLVEYIKNFPAENTSNIKFMMLLRSRLMEEEISPEYATLIVGAIDFDLSNVPEDDDTLSDIATEYASLCKRVYEQLRLFGASSIREFPAYARFFRPFKIVVDH